MRKRQVFRKLAVFTLLFLLFISFSKVAAAQTLLASGNCTETGTCQISDLMQVAITATSILLGLTGTFVLVAFVYAGFLFLVSAGSSERITQAKAIIKGAVIGALIVFLSFTIITQIFNTLGVNGNWWESNWFM